LCRTRTESLTQNALAGSSQELEFRRPVID
jgi:hypothetical protein